MNLYAYALFSTNFLNHTTNSVIQCISSINWMYGKSEYKFKYSHVKLFIILFVLGENERNIHLLDTHPFTREKKVLKQHKKKE